MKSRFRLAAVLAAALLALAPTSASAGTAPYPDPAPVTGDVTVHDPTMIRLADGEYVVYSTHNGLEARTSWDRVHFTRDGSAFPTTPAWWTTYSSGSDPWAPDVSYHDGRYLLYYAVSSFGSNHSAIGLATSRTGLPGSWTDHGIAYSSQSTDNYNTIDPNLLVDGSGRWWLTFGSYWSGIYTVAVDPATGKPYPGAARHHLATRPDAPYAVEAPVIVRHGGYYYLFASYDRCCAGVDSTYKIKVGRATSPTGPYTDENGVNMLDGGGTLLLASHGRYIGPGGQSVLRDRTGDTLVYHYYDGSDNGTPKLGLNRLQWAGGWPHVR